MNSLETHRWQAATHTVVTEATVFMDLDSGTNEYQTGLAQFPHAD